MLYCEVNGVQVHWGAATSVLGEMESSSVDCVVTSPPYWGLRDGVEERGMP